MRSARWNKPRLIFDPNSLEGSVGYTSRPQWKLQQTKKNDICFDSFTVEAIAVRFGMNLARTVGCSKVKINSDSEEVVSALKDGNSSSIASAISDDCYFMALDFTHVIYDHSNRENNQVAHEHARITRFSSSNV